MAMASEGGSPRRLPILACDGFMLAMDAMMRRSGQGGHYGGTLIELDRVPEMPALRVAWQRFVRAYPLVLGRLRRGLPGRVPRWEVPDEVYAEAVPVVELWHEPGVLGLDGAREVASVAALCVRRLNLRSEAGGREDALPNVRLDVVQCAGGGATVVVTWSHLLLDGKGVELLLTELARFATGQVDDPMPATLASASPVKLSVVQRRERRIAFLRHFRGLMSTPFTSLGRGEARAGAANFEVVTLGAAASGRVRERAGELASPLMPAPFYLACAARAHDRVFRGRGLEQPQVVTMPVQTRPKGGRGPMFQNHLSMFFVRLEQSDLETVAVATRAVQAQFGEMMRHRLDQAFSTVQNAMRRLPPRLYMAFLRWQARGEVASFFHSHTGAFAPQLVELAGAKVLHGYHLPTVCTPPGTGLFVSEWGDEMDVTLSWRGDVIDAAERGAMVEQFVADLVGEAVEVERRVVIESVSSF
ncbi:hypothetical protein ACERK3_05125 [Phycisphaerales bacterium AB-hyl4]|uniref:Condensation domain-containing protein n=1 Tax=Natronomicrosphaera hydrolytica TaxID=3242702 RepID=A0ABV4U253_9BACT